MDVSHNNPIQVRYAASPLVPLADERLADLRTKRDALRASWERDVSKRLTDPVWTTTTLGWIAMLEKAIAQLEDAVAQATA